MTTMEQEIAPDTFTHSSKVARPLEESPASRTPISRVHTLTDPFTLRVWLTAFFLLTILLLFDLIAGLFR